MKPSKEVIAAPGFSFNNKILITRSNKAGCFYCLKIFDVKEIKNYTDNGNTAICPYCSVDSILGDFSSRIDEETLIKIKKYWFY